MLFSTLCGFLAVGNAWAQSSTVDAYVASQSPIAKAGMLANIGPSGAKSEGALAGIVIASPSSVNPDYLYTWTRDSALVFKAIIDQFTLGIDTTTRTEIDNYVSSQQIIQNVVNPSGSLTTGGLGEPKFNIDETARPQRDGPALRSTALITWANFLWAEANTTYVTGTLWPLILNDLNYVAQNWNQSTFDLWEEVQSSSFFTTAVQHRSLREGVRLANTIGQTSVVSGWTEQAENLLCFLQSYWNTAGYITANTGGGRSGKDANTVLASIHTFDAAAGCDALTFQPCSDVALSNLLTYVDSFRSVFPLNSGIAENQAVATGRYPEDTYQGGNPWYLTTLAVAEQLYDALIVWKAQGSLNVTSHSLSFFQLFDSSVAVGTYASSTSTFTTLTTGVQNYADGFVAKVAQFTPAGGSLSEQYSKTNGAQVSAVDLTWSYAATLTAFDARAGTVTASWGAAGLTSSCSTASGGGGGSSSGTVEVTFNVDATTVFGQNIFICGSVDELQNWDPDTALALSSANYPIWSITVALPASTSIQYKYVNKEGLHYHLGSCHDPNMEITTPASGSFIENDTWQS
ncbi:glucoamylase [Gymnopus androsaceus JB14]|uniref:Glucoamylase n=1 Tax=Gymnopus androsaceus JB14 TaxID=1447944 RepID=A0A6A4IDI6_9AGAR|nr:glucoamylase [Gymnopus androsaceus JB14]